MDDGESMQEALVREVREETGLTVENPRAVFVALCSGRVDYLNTTYRATVWGEERTDEPIRIEWVTREVLLAGPFGDYNRKLFACLDHNS